MKILIIQQKHIGDVLTCSVLFKALRNELPEAQLDYLINTNTKAVVENNPYIDNLILFDPKENKSFRNLFQYAKGLKKYKYDVVIDVLCKPSSIILTLFSGAKKRISFRRLHTKWIYTDTVITQKKSQTPAGLAIEKRLALLSPILSKSIVPTAPKIYLSEGEITEADTFLKAHHLNHNSPLIMVNILGSKPDKTYPKTYMAFLLDLIVEEIPEVQLLFNYIPNQLPQVKAFYEACKKETQKQIHLEVYAKSLRDFIALTSQCDAVFGNEGGASNIGKALNKRTFSIFSPRISAEDWRIYEDDKNNISIHLKDYKPQLFKTLSKKALKKKNDVLYKTLTPQLFDDKLKAFLQHLNENF